MYENDYMYAIERNGEYLAHYGVKGMKWGVRKAIERGNQRALGRQYRKAAKKLAKLEKRANSGKKYARRAAALGTGAAVAGTVAGFGPSAVTRSVGAAVGGGLRGAGLLAGKAAGAMRKAGIRGSGKMSTISRGLYTAGIKTHLGTGKAATAISKWGATNTLANTAAGKAISNKAADAIYNSRRMAGSLAARTGTHGVINQNFGKVGAAMTRAEEATRKGLSNNTVARIGAGVVGAGLAGASGYNAYRAATAKRNAKKAAAFRSEMNKAFKGTQYANGAPRQGNRRRKRR